MNKTFQELWCEMQIETAQRLIREAAKLNPMISGNLSVCLGSLLHLRNQPDSKKKLKELLMISNDFTRYEYALSHARIRRNNPKWVAMTERYDMEKGLRNE
ncbi:MAG: hypothetical protein GX838_07120 [Clostridiaceae bacterium]|nr:hypothetical protein [Clostridiaceae bacterium]